MRTPEHLWASARESKIITSSVRGVTGFKCRTTALHGRGSGTLKRRPPTLRAVGATRSNPTLGPHPEEAALFARPSRRMAAGAISPVAVLRDARKCALLRTRLMDDIDLIRTVETLSRVTRA